jgi:hypothetical protein
MVCRRPVGRRCIPAPAVESVATRRARHPPYDPPALLTLGHDPHLAGGAAGRGQQSHHVPSRGWDVTSLPASPPPVPPVIPAWRGKAALREAGLIDGVESAAQATGGRVRDAWEGASEWERNIKFMTGMAAALGLPADQIDELLRDADAIQG